MALRKISDDAGKGFLYTEMKMHRYARITTHREKCYCRRGQGIHFDQVIMKVVNSDVKSALAVYSFSGYN